jgi:hypothetical protein
MRAPKRCLTKVRRLRRVFAVIAPFPSSHMRTPPALIAFMMPASGFQTRTLQEVRTMSVKTRDQAKVVPFAPDKARQDATRTVDETGHSIVGLLQKAADMANEDCERAMGLAHRLSGQMRSVEERVRALEAETAHFRERATRAEDWLARIHHEVEQTFFHNDGTADRRGRNGPTTGHP